MRAAKLTIAGAAAWVGFALFLVGIHDAVAQEDTKVVWVCSQQGNKICGPGQPEVYVNPFNLILW